jgi:hypothetical protein
LLEGRKEGAIGILVLKASMLVFAQLGATHEVSHA